MTHFIARLAFVSLCLGGILTGCGYNDFQILDEKAKSAWGDVLEQYQRRAELVPGIIAAVHPYKPLESEPLKRLAEAHAQTASVSPSTPSLANDAQAIQRFDRLQAELSSALSRLLGQPALQPPQFNPDPKLHELRAQLESTEERIALARERYVKVVQEYNNLARDFPTRLTALACGYEAKEVLPLASSESPIRPSAVTAPATSFNPKSR